MELLKKIKKIFNKDDGLRAGTLSPGNPEIFDRLGPKDIAIDCGANVGDVTALMAKNGAAVYAFEPNPYAFEVLNERFKDNPNVHCINKGVMDKPGKMPLYLHEFHEEDDVKWSTGSSFLSCKSNVKEDDFVEVELVDISNFIAKLGKKVSIMKMDVEGVEYDILEKLIESGTIKRIKLLLVETHEEKIPEIRDKAEIIRSKIKSMKL